jgi:hypothetical protein
VIKIVSLAGLGLFMLTSLVVGLRVFVLWRRTRKLPELLLSIALLFTGFLAYAMGTLGKLVLSGSPQLRSGLTLLGLSTECIGVAALIAFADRVFHPKGGWVRGVTILLFSLLALGVCGEIFSGQYMRYSDPELIAGPWVPLGLLARGLGPAWMSFECFRYHAKLKKQLALGLASPLVVHRVLLWGIGIGASATGYATSIVHRLVYGTGLRAHDWAIGLVSFQALIASVCIGIAFFPPRKYRSWAASRTSLSDG